MTVRPDAPAAPVLDPASDSGAKGDNITNVTTNLKFNVPGPRRATRSSCSATGRSWAPAPSGTGQITDPGPVQPDGVYVYTVQQIDQFGTISPSSTALNVTIVTKAPAPTLVRLDPSSDSGTAGGQHHQRHQQPDARRLRRISGGATVILLRNGVEVKQHAPAPQSGGKVTITDPESARPGDLQLHGESRSMGPATQCGQPGHERPDRRPPAPPRPWCSTRARIRGSRATASPGSTASGGVFPKFNVANVVAGATLNLLRNGVDGPVP